jgi:AraC-like DNA-binding protein
MMRLNVLPHPHLRRYVRAIQYIDTPPSEQGFVIPAQARSTLILPEHANYRLEGEIADRVTLCEATLLGPHDAPIVNYTSGAVRGFTVDFTPLGVAELLGVPQGELANTGVRACEILPASWVTALTERLHEARDDVPTAVLEICTALTAVSSGTGVREASRLIQQVLTSPLPSTESGGTFVRSLARDSGVSTRHLNREFNRYFGIDPRRYSLVQRVQHAMELLSRGLVQDLSALALELGFYDYPHFSNEFKRFALTTPHAFLRSQRHSEYRVVASAPQALQARYSKT